MNYDGKLLAQARSTLDRNREQNAAEQQRRTALIYSLIPEIAEIDGTMRAQMAELVRLTISRTPDLAVKLHALQESNLDLQMRRAELLTEKGYPIDYLDEIISCKLCHDTGYVDGAVCECLKKQYNRELTKELAVLLRDGSESFENFSLDYYSDSPDPATGRSPREVMEVVLSGCRKFANNFPDVSTNLMLRGGTGLGKTYLSACIARVVAEKGFSVCYDTASSALEAFERQKFARSPEESEAASLRVRRMLSCDLMILDDLGTEMVTPMSTSALYTLINTRLTGKQRTVISTNCSNAELERRYNDQICSRLYGEYLELPFVGTDIRLQKRKK